MVMGGFIVGLDSDTEEIFDAQFDFIQEAGIPAAMVGILAAMPHTQLYQRLEKEGRIRKEILHSGDNVSLSVNYTPTMPVDTLINGYRRLMERLYDPKNYYDRCIRMLERSPRQAQALEISMFPKNMHWRRKAQALAGASRLFFKHLLSPHGMHYLRFLLEAQRITRERGIHPSFNTNAVVEAAKGYQYFSITKQILDSGPV
jgi:hypothetical protein